MILEKLKIILDYKNNRVILEPNARFDDPIDYIRSGLDLESVGENYQTFKIKLLRRIRLRQTPDFAWRYADRNRRTAGE